MNIPNQIKLLLSNTLVMILTLCSQHYFFGRNFRLSSKYETTFKIWNELCFLFFCQTHFSGNDNLFFNHSCPRVGSMCNWNPLLSKIALDDRMNLAETEDQTCPFRLKAVEMSRSITGWLDVYPKFLTLRSTSAAHQTKVMELKLPNYNMFSQRIYLLLERVLLRKEERHYVSLKFKTRFLPWTSFKTAFKFMHCRNSPLLLWNITLPRYRC